MIAEPCGREPETHHAKLVQTSIVATALAAAAVSAVISVSMTRTSGQTAQSARPARVAGKPNFGGVWQALNEAHWDLQAHEARAGMVTQKGVYSYEYAKVPAAPVLALGAAARRARVARSGAG